MATHRLFFALPITDDVRSVLRDARASAQRCTRRARVTWVDPTIAHVTLHFLGSVPDERVGALTQVAEEAVAAWRGRGVACRLVSSSSVSGFPRPEATRTIILPVEDVAGCAALLHGELRQRMTSLRLPTDSRPWSPHLTVGRVRDSAVDLRPCVRIALHGTPWSPTALELLESRITTNGPRYTIIASFPLNAA